jgi:hypothetical protein
MRRTEKTTTVAIPSELLGTDQDIDQIDEHREREDELEDVGDAHMRSSHAAKANMPAKKTIASAMTVISTMHRP